MIFQSVLVSLAWRKDYTCRHSQWTSCKRWSLEWAAPTGTQPYTVFGYKDFCGSTVLGTPESVGMNGQTDWRAQQISHLVCSLAGQRCSEAWGTFSTRTSQSITALTAWRKEEWRKEAADIPPSKVENDLCSTRQILALFRGQPWGDCWETGRSAYGPFRALRCHLELKLKLVSLLLYQTYTYTDTSSVNGFSQ